MNFESRWSVNSIPSSNWGGWVQISDRTTATPIEEIRDVIWSAHINAKTAGT